MEREIQNNEQKNVDNAVPLLTELMDFNSHARTVLSGIVGMSAILEAELVNPEQKQYVRWINSSGEKLLNQLNNLLLNNESSLTNEDTSVTEPTKLYNANTQYDAGDTIYNPETPFILLVEDNLMALRIAEIIVDKAGCRYISVHDAKQALQLVKTSEFDLIITDIKLPGMSGKELSSSIREWERSLQKKPVPIIGLTAQKLSSDDNEVLLESMNKILFKPFSAQLLQDLLNQYVVPVKTQSSNFYEHELPENDEQLFALEKYQLFAADIGLQNLGNETILKDLLQLMVDTAIPEDKALIEMAYQQQDWQQVVSLAHKIKSGALYCGAVRMQYACLYLELCVQENYRKYAAQLYHQLLAVLEDTKRTIKNYLIAIA